jgi:hypothetical protein
VIRSCNYTGRINLDHGDVEVSIANSDSQDLCIDWTRCTKSVVDDAKVVIEANTAGGMHSLRFEWGTWANPVPPVDRSLKSLGATTFAFDVKAVDPASGRLLAAVWGVRPVGAGDESSGATESLLWLNFEDLGQTAWSLEFGNEGVTLNVNERLPNARAFAGSPVFVALVFPAVVRLVLARALVEGADEDGVLWAQRWVAWGRELKPTDEETLERHEDGLRPEQEEWIEGVAREFGAKFHSVDAVVSEAEAT